MLMLIGLGRPACLLYSMPPHLLNAPLSLDEEVYMMINPPDRGQTVHSSLLVFVLTLFLEQTLVACCWDHRELTDEAVRLGS